MKAPDVIFAKRNYNFIEMFFVVVDILDILAYNLKVLVKQ